MASASARTRSPAAISTPPSMTGILLYRAADVHAARKDRESQIRNLRAVAHGAVDDQAGDPTHLAS